MYCCLCGLVDPVQISSLTPFVLRQRFCSGCLPCTPADDDDAANRIDDDTVVVEDDEIETEDSDAVMVDALEALRLSQPHITHASNTGQHSDENQRPQTATGGRHSLDNSSLANGSSGMEGKVYSPLKGSSLSRRQINSRLAPLADGSMWGMFGKGDEECNGVTHDFGGNSSVQSGLQSRLVEAAEDMQDVDEKGQQQEDDTGFNGSQYWKMPLAMPDDIENA